MKRLIIALFTIFVFAGCLTTEIAEPKRDSKDPSLVRLEYHLGKDKEMMMKKLETKYGVIQKKYGKSGRFYNADHSFTYFYEGNKLVRLVLPVQQTVPHLRAYTGKLPFKLLRKDTYDSVVNKLGKPSGNMMNKTILNYDKKGLIIHFINGTIATVTMEAK